MVRLIFISVLGGFAASLVLLVGGCEVRTPKARPAVNSATDVSNQNGSQATAPAGAETAGTDSADEQTLSAAGRAENAVAAPTKPGDPAGIHNLVRISDHIYSGSEPHGEVAFESLAKLGVKTIVSVDGARPDLEAAKRHGLRYVHIPIGYNGIHAEAGKALARVAREADGPLYIHCHHGQHRGPAAAAVACMAADGRSGAQASEILKAAGTGDQYTGLWRDVENYQPPGPNEALPELVEVAEVDSFPAAMAKLDRHFDNLKLCQKSDWQTPADHPDLDPAQEALLVWEGLKESARHLNEQHSDEFKSMLGESTILAEQLQQTLSADNRDPATEQFSALEKSCKSCHGKYRNQ
ncbi:MAG: cytochrome c [Planctomycetales bacterium]|nr:cytochrome c [Planctomycetales bacterium]